ncbi:MAG: hypothetical protein JWL63_3595 [Rhodocyclales bacterium]|nr:hypothetical protein [Rhodocyclales bacterium]
MENEQTIKSLEESCHQVRNQILQAEEKLCRCQVWNKDDSWEMGQGNKSKSRYAEEATVTLQRYRNVLATLEAELSQVRP